MIVHDSLTRRTLLRSVGAVVALPWLESFASAAEIEKPPVRLGFVYVPNGVDYRRWHVETPDGPLVELSAGLKPLEAHKNDLLLFRGLTLDQGRGHGDVGGDHARETASFLTAAHAFKSDGRNIRIGGISVDQLAASQLGHLTRLPSLELAADHPPPPGTCEHGYSLVYRSSVSWRSPTQPVPIENDPRLAFARLFGNANRNSTEESIHRSILDLVREEAKMLNNSLGGADRRQVDEYLTSVREVERRIYAADQIPPQPLPSGVRSPEFVASDVSSHIRAMLDLMVLAFQTDSTRIVSLMLAMGGSNRAFPELGFTSGHHGYSHHGGKANSLDALHAIDKFYAAQFAYLLQELKKVKEGSGTLLDHCLLLYGSSMRDGGGHDRHDLPVLLAGSGSGAVSPGRIVRFANETPMANLFLNMLDAVGIEEPRFSDSTGRLAGLKI